jgi:hypothetical protein
VSYQLFSLFILALPVASIAWTITHEDLFRELRTMCVDRSQSCRSLAARKFFYLLTCEYCFSHYVTILVLGITRFHLLFPDWRGYVVAGFALVWIANIYMSAYGRLRLDIQHERVDIAADEKALEESKRRAAGPREVSAVPRR